MRECFTPDLKDKLLGCKVGDTIDSEVDKINHSITVLGIRKAQEQILDETEIVHNNLADQQDVNEVDSGEAKA